MKVLGENDEKENDEAVPAVPSLGSKILKSKHSPSSTQANTKLGAN